MVNLAALKSMSPEAFAYLGAPALAYVKEVKVEGEPAYAVHAADGTAICATRQANRTTKSTPELSWPEPSIPVALQGVCEKCLFRASTVFISRHPSP